jgi:hypothetical protein
MVGGFSVRKNENSGTQTAGGKSKKKGGIPDSDDEDDGKGIIHEDIWALDFKNYTWEKVKKAGMAPTPRTSFGLVTHKARAVFFGGVHDREGAGDRLYSELFNEAYQFNMVSRRWFPLAMRPPKKTGANNGEQHTPEASSATEDDNEKKEIKAVQNELPPGVSPEMHAELMKIVSSKNSPLVKAATRIQAAYRGHMVRSAMKAYKLGGQVSELLYSPATYGIDLSAKDMMKPRARSAPMLAVLRHTLWMWGGMVEIGHTDVVLDDLWSVDLNKLDGWKVVKENTAGEDAFKEWSEGEGSEDEQEGWETD